MALTSRAALLEGYGPYGAEWQGGMADIDNLLSITGLEQVYGVVYPLVETVGAAAEPDPLDADAMRLGAAFVAVRVHQAVARAITLLGLPRRLTVIVGSNESYPFYDAPVVSAAESVEFVHTAVEDAPVEDASVEEAPVESGAVEPENDELAEPEAGDDDNTVVQLSGASLRQRIGQQPGGVAPAPQPAAAPVGLLRRLFAR